MLFIIVSMSMFLTSISAFSQDNEVGRCTEHLEKKLPDRSLTPQEQAGYEFQLRDLFQKQPFSKIEPNPYRQSLPSYIVSFHGTSIRAILKKVAFNDIYRVKEQDVNIGLRGAIASESDYQVSKRMGCHCYPFVVKRTISESDPIHQQIEGLESGQYVVTYLIESAFKKNDANRIQTTSDEKYGRRSHRDAAYVRVQLFELIVGDADGIDPIYDPIAKLWIGVDGIQSFMRDWSDLPVLYGQVSLNKYHYLNDRSFFDRLADLNPEAVFRGLEKMRGPSGPYTLRYAAAKKRLIQVQNFVRQTRERLL